jgi:hypothetical protein
MFAPIFLLANVVCPSPNWTPGAVFPTATIEIVSTPGYSERVRNVSAASKKRVCARYHAEACPGPNWEIDHLIPLCAGGSNDEANLWPQNIVEAAVKDKLENYVCRQLRNRKMTMVEAQLQASTCIRWGTP